MKDYKARLKHVNWIPPDELAIMLRIGEENPHKHADELLEINNFMIYLKKLIDNSNEYMKILCIAREKIFFKE